MKIISKLASLTVLLVACGVRAASVDTADVTVAAKTWAARGAALGARVGTGGVDSVTAHAVTNGYSFYAVRLTGGGTVFFSSDTELEPIIAFSPDSNINLSNEKNPLLQLLRRDIIARVGLRDLRKASLAAGGAAQGAADSESEQKWAALVAADSKSARTGSGSSATTSSAAPVRIVDDICVAPLLTTKWNQTTAADGKPCFNYYMWEELGGKPSKTDVWPCGCTATALSQVMRYFRYPTAEQAAKEFLCSVDGAYTILSTKAGVFDWDNMPDYPEGMYNITAAQREAIGRLTWNAAVALNSVFTEDLGSAIPYEVAAAMRDAFGYASAWAYWDDANWYKGSGGLHDRATREKIVHANLDAGRPVQFGIYGYPTEHIGDRRYWEGHAVVGDGYGYQTVNGAKTVYVHINMGWGGIDDVWYNIPEIDAANSGAQIWSSGTTFLYMGGATFNIAATAADAGEILSGRIYDEDGQPMAGAVVSAYENGELVGSTVSGEYGVYGFVLPGGHTYTVSARSADGKYVSVPLRDIALNATVGNSSYVVSSEADVGNSWGNDLVLEHPSVRVGTAIYGSLDAAIEAAKSEGLENPVIEIVDSTGLRESVTIDFACTIVSTNADPLATLITRDDGAQLTVADGGSVAFTNVAFASEVKDTVLISVEKGGSVSVAGTVGLGHIVTADAGGFVLAGAIEPVEMGVVLGSAGETTLRGTVFGLYTCSLDVATANAAKIVKYDDDEFGGAANEAGQLIWDRVPVDPSAALAVATNDEFGTTYYRSLNQLFADYTNGAEIVILKDCATNTFTKPLTIAKAVTLCSRGTPRVIQPASTACITIKDGGSLTIANLTFADFTGPRLFSVAGGSLTLEDGATLKDMTGTGYSDEDGNATDVCGVVCMSRGTLTTMPGSSIVNCSVESDGGGIGGGIAALGGTLNLKGGTITGCSAIGMGGGVYSPAATVNLSGAMQVTGNVNVDGKADNIYLGKKGTLLVVGALEDARIGVRSATSANNAAGKAFATVKAALTDDQLAATAAAFSCDAAAALSATARTASGATTLVWDEKVDDGTCDESEAVVRVIYPKGSSDYPGGTNFCYDAVSKAFARLTGAATVEVLADATFDADLTVSQAVTLVSAEGASLTLSRAKTKSGATARIAIADVGSLTVTNLTISGSDLVESSGRAMIEVAGSLTLQKGAKVSNVRSMGYEDVAARGAILVSSGTLTMESGSVIADCTCVAEDEAYGAGAGVYLVDGTAYFNGGSVTNCSASSLAGVYAVKNSKIYVSGDFSANGNSLQYYYPTVKSNLSVAKGSELYLTGAVTNRIGYTADAYASETTFGRIPDWREWTFQDLTNSAAQFRNDATDKRGVVVTNDASVALLVWESALGEDGSYTDDSVENGATYWVTAIPEPDEITPIVVPCEPFTITGVKCVSEGVWELTLNPAVEFCTYRLYGSDDLSSIVDDANLKAEKTLEASDIDADGSFTMQVESPMSRQFWRIVGESGERYE